MDKDTKVNMLALAVALVAFFATKSIAPRMIPESPQAALPPAK